MSPEDLSAIEVFYTLLLSIKEIIFDVLISPILVNIKKHFGDSQECFITYILVQYSILALHTSSVS